MPRLVITRGLPASGKTTYARAWVEANPESRLRVNRDDLRQCLYGMSVGVLPYALEQTVTAVQHAAVKAALASRKDVIVDDTHLRLKYARAYADIAVEAGAEFEVFEFATDTEECVRRDAARGALGERMVGEQVIRDIAARFGGLRPGSGRGAPAVEPTERTAEPGWLYVPDRSLPSAWMVDIDGTVALKGDRDQYDETRVGVDLPNPAVIEVVRALRAAGHAIVFTSGRGSGCYQQTLGWLDHYLDLPQVEEGGLVLRGYHLFMRPQGDTRRDSLVKIEMLRDTIAKQWHVVGVLDDRNQVVDAWRRAGLTCLQVADGAF